MRIRSNEYDEDQEVFEEEMRKMEEKLIHEEMRGVRKKKKRIFPMKREELNRIIKEEIMGNLVGNRQFKEMAGQRDEAQHMGIPFHALDTGTEGYPVDSVDKYSIDAFKEAIMAYKKDSKNFFLGDQLGKCCRKRRINDKWYAWTKEMLESIDRNEEAMKRVLIEYGHEQVQKMITESEQEKGIEGWNTSIQEKVDLLIDGLKSVQEKIEGDGLSTILGTIKYNGTILKRIKDSMNMFMKNDNQGYDVIDYIRYRNKKLEDHYKKIREKNERKNLYYN